MPVIGITVDNKANTASSGTYECAVAYSRAVAEAGGTPVLLPHCLDQVEAYLALCDGFILTGGVDPDVRAFGQDLHPQARVMDPQRQAFETALLQRLRPDAPCLGVCLGMQMMALVAGGRLNQYMPDDTPTHADHYANSQHPVRIIAEAPGIAPVGGQGVVTSHHRQAVAHPGRLAVVAAAPDGVVEAVADVSRPFYVGLQWHPERTPDGPLSKSVFSALIAAASGRR